MRKSEPARKERNRSAIMRLVHSKDTTPEILFRRELWLKGYRYKVAPLNLPGKPDIVFQAKRVAIFIDGDFWHGNQWRKRGLSALEEQFSETISIKYWLKKIRRNMYRDTIVTSSLLSAGWTVLRYWESEIKTDLDRCVNMTLNVLRHNVKPDVRSLLPSKTAAEFFAGIGLMRMGLERGGWNVSLANDIDPRKYEMYRGHFGNAGAHFLLDDIHKIQTDTIPPVTLMTASFPCNDLSLAGARRGLVGEQSSAFWGFVNILRNMKDQRPPLVLLENVTGFLTSHGGHDFKSALLALNDLGYSVDAFIIDAARFVPQSRQRLFVVGVRNDVAESTVPEAKEPLRFYESDTRPKALADYIFEHPEINWSIRKLPSLPQCNLKLADIIEDIADDSQQWWSQERVEYLLNQMSPRHHELVTQMIAGDDYSYGTVFRRVRNGKSMAELRTDGVAGCLRTPRGGSGRQILVKAGKGKFRARLISPRECARLMGAVDYVIDAPLNQALFGFGDAVCVPVIEWITEYYLNPLVNELIRGQPLINYQEGVYFGGQRKSA